MCERACLSSDVSETKLRFSIPPERSTPDIPANWNVAPTEDLPVVRYDANGARRPVGDLALAGGASGCTASRWSVRSGQSAIAFDQDCRKLGVRGICHPPGIFSP